MSAVPEKLRALRKRAGLSMQTLARAAGWKHASGYQRYEDPAEFRRPYLPMHVARRLAPVLASHGVAAAEVLALAGVVATDADTPAPPGLVPDTVRVAVEALARYLAESKLTMAPAAQGELVVAFAAWHGEEVHAGRLDAVLTVPLAMAYLRLMHRGRER